MSSACLAISSVTNPGRKFWMISLDKPVKTSRGATSRISVLLLRESVLFAKGVWFY